MSERFRYWSNGTEGYSWMANFCDRCINDHACHTPDGDPGNGCQIVTRIYFEDDHRTIGELVHDEATEGYCGGGVRCVEYRKCTKCDPDPPGDGPTPVDPIPGQGLLFEVDEHHLMYRDVLIDEGLIVPERADAEVAS